MNKPLELADQQQGSIAAVDKQIIATLDTTIGIPTPLASGAQAIASFGDTLIHHKSYGYTFQPPKGQLVTPDTLFDLASLTKVLVTTQAIIGLYGQHRIRLQLRLGEVLPFTAGTPLGERSIASLLDHSSGLPPTCSEKIIALAKQYQLNETLPGPNFYRHQQVLPLLLADLQQWMVNEMPLQPVASQMVYSDVNYLLLGWVVEHLLRQPLDKWFLQAVAQPLGIAKALHYLPHDIQKHSMRTVANCAATEQCVWRNRLLQAEVHDKTAWALGGISGHAGLFGTAYGVWKICHELVRSYHGESDFVSAAAVKKFWTKTATVIDSTRTLGWDTPTRFKSSAGKLLPLTSVGHLGFTGTSIWIEPRSRFIGVLLLNRAYPHPDGKESLLFQLRSRVFSIWSKYVQQISFS